MTIRPYSPADAIKCREIFISNVPKYFAQEELEKLDNWLDALHNGTVPSYAEAIYFYVLEVENEIIGAAGFYLMKGENNGQLNWGMVHADHHNKGYGKLLFDYRVNKIKEIAPSRQATLWTSQYTYAFFEKLGMKIVKITPNGFGFGFDKYEMSL
ncbi:MAG TPA: GNAT family N-acetyltransferase [Bacteroidia bacterium]|jgi:ribosomal-protein-alanine N-acetyltransferase|nr:GNAT family N-acetyltransferase [Bacteroidia bacterium]